jgi:hypothetical protein
MKKKLLIAIYFLLVLISPKISLGQSIDEINEQYSKDYEALKPPSSSSSVKSDYVFEQTALSTQQTARLLKLIYEQNQAMLANYQGVLEKFDEIIRQNNEIIKLLSKDAAKGDSPK